MLDANRRAKVADVGASKIFSSLQSVMKIRDKGTFVGTKTWMSPEMRKVKRTGFKNIQQHKSDIFSLGLIALFCLDPIEFGNQRELNKEEKVLESYLDDFMKRIQVNNKYFQHFSYMLRCMLSFSPFTRPSITEIYKDFPEFTSFRSENIRLSQVILFTFLYITMMLPFPFIQ